ncbi:undecaprenyl-diphosphatase UppP [Boudabousia liubingyangii]|uniref:Undecaprenyl-diphosphatase n=1 Tax=Boudabousia liubingyangii TaxID=1921764 RepID=A0A1Q5PND6_9ACTO|nr:undecaprenyl-diphosphate phosphatase [Boudabousia liubingyangii]OKL47615.1 undecaprenyl-diphosphatase UppP [Boudabousia liubingyangii]OKL49039.1 undecaprenyl-diphosphatase UppP [Boudabousia liubingyangii]
MDYLYATIMGLVQGLTEFLPISSSAHLRITSDLLGIGDPGAAFTAIIQIGTELAVLIYFWKDIWQILTHWYRSMPWVGEGHLPSSDPHVRLGWMIIVGSIPIGVLGLLLEKWIDTTFRNLWITVFMLAFFGALLGLADGWSKREKTLDKMTWGQAIAYGGAQALALIPGVSRSGGTITAGRLMGFKRPDAARYSFLLAMPAVFASGLYKVAKVLSGPTVGEIQWGPTLLATVVCFVVGYAVIVWFLKLISTKSFMPFVWYRLGLAAVVSVLLLTGVLHANAIGV